MGFNPFIGGGGGTSSEDKVARAEIAAIKDGENLDSFGDVETALGDKADTSTTYTKTEVDTALSAKANSADVYSKTAVDTALGNKADKSTTYTKTEVDTSLGNKADKSTTYTKTEVDTALGNKVDKETGKGLSTNDYTTAEKTKLAGIEAQANKTTVDDALSGSSTNPVQNKVIKSALDSKANTTDIPTVPITAIQKNGTGIVPVSGTVNITVPTSAADVSALPDTTKYAAALSLTINSSTFVMTGQLKDQNGDNLGTAQTIDLPLESVVVGGSYNSQTKKVVLTLQNGNTIEFSVADLVSGLQTELSVSNKLNPAYIDYDSTHRAVSDTEKSTWNDKQNAISDLETIRSGAAAGATAVQPISGKGLSTNDYTDAEKTKLTGIAEGAEVNVQSDWAQTTTAADDYIKNKPTLGTAAALDVAASGNASTSQVVKGNDTRLTDARNAADVSSWAKAANKPSYNGSEIALTGYTEAQSKSNVAATDTTNAAIGKLEYRVETNENNISSLETKVNTNTSILSQTYNSADCNISLILRQDSTEDLYVHYDTEARKLYMPYKVIKNQYKYWKDGVAYPKYHVLTEGVIMTNNSAKCNMLMSDTPEVTNETYNHSWVAIDDGGSAVTSTFNLSKANSEIGDVWYNRSYIIYDDLETGMRYKMYGPVYKITAGTPCTVECATLSCTELTALSAENRAALVELVDGGAKNVLEFDAIGTATTYGTTCEINGVKFTLNADNTVTFERISTSSSAADCLLILNGTLHDVSSYCDGNHILSGCPSGGSGNTYEIMATVMGGPYTKHDYGTGVILDSASGMIGPYIHLMVRSGFTGTATFKPMICTKAAWDISHEYQPYRPSYQELYEQVIANKNNISLLRTFMAYVGYSEVIKVEKQVDNPNRIKFYIQSYYNGDVSTVTTGCLVARSLPLNTDLTVDNAEADSSAPGLKFSGTANDSRGDGLGIVVKPYIKIDGVRHYGVQQRYFYSDLA